MKAESNSETKSWLKYFLSSKKELFLNFEAIKVYAHEWERINQDEKIIDNQNKYKRLQKELEDIFDKSDDDFVKVIIGVAFVKGFYSVVPREKPHTGAADREQPRDSPVIERCGPSSPAWPRDEEERRFLIF